MGRIMLATSASTDEEYGGTTYSRKTVWTGSVYQQNDEFTIQDFSESKTYIFIFKGYSSSATMQFVAIPLASMQFIIQGETSQYRRYRFTPKNQTMDGNYVCSDVYGTGDAGTALIRIEELG
jgi:hypothetical protein